MSESVVNTSALRRATNFYVSKVFHRLPQAYRCFFLSRITKTTKGKTFGSAEETEDSLREALAKLSKELHLAAEAGECANVESRPTPKTYVRLGIRLRKLMPLKVWLQRFKNKLPSLYLKYISKSGKVSQLISGWKRDESGNAVAVIPRNKYLVKLEEDPAKNDNVVIVTFSILSRQSSGYYTAVDSEDVAAALNQMRRSQLNNILQAEVIGSSAYVRDESRRTNRRRKKKLSEAEVARLKPLFPRYLLKFFKSLSSPERCYILLQISSYLGQDLLLIEKSYHSLGSLQKKLFCTRSPKQDSKSETRTPHLLSVWGKLDQLSRTVSKNVSSSAVPTTAALTRNTMIIRETRPFNSMEIVMFVLLGFLCVLIMAFVANCIVFTFKTKQLNSKYDEDAISPDQLVEATEKKTELPENNKETMKISDNPLSHFNDDLRFRLLVSPLLQYTENSSEKNAVIGRKSGMGHSKIICCQTSKGVTVCEEITLSDDEPEKLSVV